MPDRMRLVMSEGQLKGFRTIVHSLNKIGAEMRIEARSDKVVLFATNSSQTCCLSVSLMSLFFDAYECQADQLKTALLLKHMLFTFRTQKVLTYTMELTSDVCEVVVEGELGLRKHFRLRCVDTDGPGDVTDQIDRDNYVVSVVAEVPELTRLLSTFPPTQEDVSLVAWPHSQQGAQSCLLQSYVDPNKSALDARRGARGRGRARAQNGGGGGPDAGGAGASMHTCLELGDASKAFLAYRHTGTAPTEATFNLKDFRVMCAMCEAMQANMILRVHTPGVGMLMEPHFSNAIHLSATMMLSTLAEWCFVGEEEQAGGAAQQPQQPRQPPFQQQQQPQQLQHQQQLQQQPQQPQQQVQGQGGWQQQGQAPQQQGAWDPHNQHQQPQQQQPPQQQQQFAQQQHQFPQQPSAQAQQWGGTDTRRGAGAGAAGGQAGQGVDHVGEDERRAGFANLGGQGARSKEDHDPEALPKSPAPHNAGGASMSGRGAVPTTYPHPQQHQQPQQPQHHPHPPALAWPPAALPERVAAAAAGYQQYAGGQQQQEAWQAAPQQAPPAPTPQQWQPQAPASQQHAYAPGPGVPQQAVYQQPQPQQDSLGAQGMLTEEGGMYRGHGEGGGFGGFDGAGYGGYGEEGGEGTEEEDVLPATPPEEIPL